MDSRLCRSESFSSSIGATLHECVSREPIGSFVSLCCRVRKSSRAIFSRLRDDGFPTPLSLIETARKDLWNSRWLYFEFFPWRHPLMARPHWSDHQQLHRSRIGLGHRRRSLLFCFEVDFKKHSRGVAVWFFGLSDAARASPPPWPPYCHRPGSGA